MPRYAGAPSGGTSRARALPLSAPVSADYDEEQEENASASAVHMRPILLWTHDPPNFSQHDFVMNPAISLPNESDTELLMLMNASTFEEREAALTLGKDPMTLDTTRTLVFRAKQAVADAAVVARQPQLQLSVSRSIASLCHLSNRSQAVIMRTPREHHIITHMELYFRDQYMGRADMWRLALSRIDSCVYIGQVISLPTGLRAKVGRLFVHKHSVLSGYVDTSTKPIFRSESARCTIFIQMSKEMWEFDEHGELYYEKVLHGFLPDMLRRWKVIGTNHVVSLVLFTRVLYDESEKAYLNGLPLQCTSSGEWYVDYYKVVLDLDSLTQWPAVMRILKEEFYHFQHDILLRPVSPGADIDRRRLLGRFASAYQGNLLEAVNMELNSSNKHYIDRDLTRTGFLLIVLTAGTGHFHADKALLRLTTQRMFDQAISMDLVCLSQMPLHTVPLFHHKSTEPTKHSPSHDPLFQDATPRGSQYTYYSMPYWINCSFYQADHSHLRRRNRFVPRCRMNDTHLLELLGARKQHITLPYLLLPHASLPTASGSHAREQHDRDQFAPLHGMPSAPPPWPPDLQAEAPRPASLPATRWSQGSSTPSLSSAVSGQAVHRLPYQHAVGKAAPVVGETATTLLAVRSAASSRFQVPATMSDVLFRSPSWRSLLPWQRPTKISRGQSTTSGNASRVLNAVLRASHTKTAPTLIEHCTRAASHVVADTPTLDDGSDGMQPKLSPDTPRQLPVGPPTSHSSQHALLLRWQHVFLERANKHTVKWWSMSSPACLPLTTRYLPHARELATSWHEYPYTVSVHSDTSSIMLKRGASSSSPALRMLREMCAQRLSQGFQLVERPVFLPNMASPHHIVVRYPTELLRPGNFADGEPIYLSTMNQVHCITYNRQAGMIHVTRYIHKVPYDTTPTTYRCCVWPRAQVGYHPIDVHFQYPDPHAYNWAYLDSIIAGYEDTFTESLLYWRARFVVVPSEHPPNRIIARTGEYLNDEEVRLAGMDRLADLFARAEHFHDNESLRFLPTTLDPSCSMRDESFLCALTEMHDELERQRSHKDRAPMRDVASRSLAQLADDMLAASAELKIHSRQWHNVWYSDTFTGADLVTWLCRSFSDVHTRDEAVQLASRLQQAGHITHVLGVHGFMDGHYFYRLTRLRQDLTTSSTPMATSSSGTNKRKERRRVPLSRRMLIDVDPDRRSSRSEVAILHHDLAHNAENGFNFQIHWLGATARLIDDLVQTWTRAVERYGLRLVEAPIGQIKDVGLHNPFQAPVPISLVLDPPTQDMYLPTLERIHGTRNAHAPCEPTDHLESWITRHVFGRDPKHTDHLFETALLRHFGFVLDQEAQDHFPRDIEFHYSSRPNNFDYTQFVHRSGVAFVQMIGGPSGFLWLDNRLFNPRAHFIRGLSGGIKSKRAPPPDADHVRCTFQHMCQDRDALASFYDRVWGVLRRLCPSD